MSFDKAFFDLDGTVHVSGQLISGVDLELRRLDAQGVRCHYMTNNTSVSSNEYHSKLGAMGLPLHDTAIISPTLVLARWLRKQGYDRIYSVGTATFSAELAERAGAVQNAVNPACVILAYDKELTYGKLEQACRLINAGVPYYLTHIDLACPSLFGPIPDCGAIGRLVAATTGRKANGHFGKPGDLMLEYLRSLLRPADRVLVAGDRVYTDAEIGLKLGGETVLVCTGEYQPGSATLDPRIVVSESLSVYLRGHRQVG